MFSIIQSIVEESMYIEFSANDVQFTISTRALGNSFVIDFTYTKSNYKFFNRHYVVGPDLVHKLLEAIAIIISSSHEALSANGNHVPFALPPQYSLERRINISDVDDIAEIKDAFRAIWTLPRHSEYYSYLKANFDWVYKSRIKAKETKEKLKLSIGTGVAD